MPLMHPMVQVHPPQCPSGEELLVSNEAFSGCEHSCLDRGGSVLNNGNSVGGDAFCFQGFNDAQAGGIISNHAKEMAIKAH